MCPEANDPVSNRKLKDKGIPEDRIHFELFHLNGESKMNFQKNWRGKPQQR